MHHRTVLNMAANTEFKVPLLPLTASKKPAINLPKFDFNDLILQEELGRGGFGVVYKAKHFNQTVVVKQMLHHDVHMKKLFIKEAKLLHLLAGKTNNGVVQFLSFSEKPMSIQMEYLTFNFLPLTGEDKHVSNLGELIQTINDDCEFKGFEHLQLKIAKDLVFALEHLHKEGIAHRDLKPNNCLVSNLHYCHERNQTELAKAFQTNPVVCKLSDFGESRAEYLQTQSMIESRTSKLSRGTPVYMAPELFMQKFALRYATHEDLKRADVWSLGMIFYILINPDLRTPYQVNFDQSRGVSWQLILQENLSESKKPLMSNKYENNRGSQWSVINRLFDDCVDFKPLSRPMLDHIGDILKNDKESKCVNILLSMSQESAMESYNLHAAQAIANSVMPSLQLPTNNGSNSCAFLSLAICDDITSQLTAIAPNDLSEEEFSFMLKTAAERQILHLPSSVNQVRDVKKFYDISEAYAIMKNSKILLYEYDFYEKIQDPEENDFLKKSGSEAFTRSLKELADEETVLAVFSLDKYCFTIGVAKGKLFVIETHKISCAVGGNGNGIIKMYPDKSIHSVTALSYWIRRRLQISGLKKAAGQSLLVIKKLESPVQESSPVNETQPKKIRISGSENLPPEDSSQQPQEPSQPDEMSNMQHSMPIMEAGMFSNQFSLEPETSTGHQNSHNHYHPHSISDPSSPNNSNAESPATAHSAASIGMSKVHKHEQVSQINGYPVYKVTKFGLSVKEALKTCLAKHEQSLVCKSTPKAVFQNAVFIVDLEYESTRDLTTDHTGIYKSHTCPTIIVQVFKNIQNDIRSVKVVCRKISKLTDKEIETFTNSKDHYFVHRQYSYHSTLPLTRIISKFQYQGCYIDKAIIQYKMDETLSPAKVQLPPHGNSKVKEAFVKSRPTMLEEIKKLGKAHPPKQIIKRIEDDHGGVFAMDQRDTPRDSMQVHNALRNVSCRKRSRDTGRVKTADMSKLYTMLKCGSFVQDVSVKKRPESQLSFARTFAATETCIHWVKSFCSTENPKTVMEIDMTYKMGPYFTTPMTFAHPMFVYKNNCDKHVSIFAGMMTSETRERDDYRYMASNLQSFGIKSLVYGSDSELALQLGWEDVFPITENGNIHLICFTHLEDDARRALDSTGISKERAEEILRELFRGEFKGQRVLGIVDLEDESEVDEYFRQKEKDYPKKFIDWLKGEKFRIRDFITVVKKCLLKPVRVAAGLGNPPNKFTTQRAEAMNNILKEEVDRRKVDQAELHELLLDRVVNYQNNQMVKAIYSGGDYRLAESYKDLAIDPVKWSTMTEEQKVNYTKKVFRVCIKEDDDVNEILNGCNNLSVLIPDADLDEVPRYILRDIWRRAAAIINKYEIISLGNGNICVTEHDGCFNVSCSQKDKKTYSCSCKQFLSTAGLCSHVIAVVEKRGELREYLDKFKGKKGKVSKVIFGNPPRKAGQKPGTKKRKGKNGVQKKPILAVVDPKDFSYPRSTPFTEAWHNNEPFYAVFVMDYRRAKQCEHCRNAFPRSRKMRLIPFDLVILHRERYWYPDPKTKKWQLTKKQLGKKFYCIKRNCISERFPYFWVGLLKVKKAICEKLKEGHLTQLKKELDWTPDIECLASSSDEDN